MTFEHVAWMSNMDRESSVMDTDYKVESRIVEQDQMGMSAMTFLGEAIAWPRRPWLQRQSALSTASLGSRAPEKRPPRRRTDGGQASGLRHDPEQ